jgi:hydrogenase maturation factor HypF (carbamoyltransferase family)
MRNEEELSLLDALNRGVCPDCKCNSFEDGPRGGVSQNIRCTACGSRFNVAPRYLPADSSPLLFAERI